jgi:outer membrane protein OmpA-like peptidoglycan-associated protein
MKNAILPVLGAVAALAMVSTSAYADRWSFVPHLQYPAYQEEYDDLLTHQQRSELDVYLDYEEREPCQKYRIPPSGFYRDACDLKYYYPESITPVMARGMAVENADRRNVLATYKITFDFDRASLDSGASRVLDQVAREIKQFNPREVTISGHADSSGPSAYNMALSQRRADGVSMALNDRGIANRVIDSTAYGEGVLAVETGDGVALLENRRVTIEFLK